MVYVQAPQQPQMVQQPYIQQPQQQVITTAGPMPVPMQQPVMQQPMMQQPMMQQPQQGGQVLYYPATAQQAHVVAAQQQQQPK
eukprot:CAMPEP_0201596456 /NCGR_PEP_ID=MMETSP0190_2-20130828/193134_1 /ASSEMBLY_ACC=CAM_ASM_000263 /TAXON_ID=37353 /ORGANISM="Rosalina sp." /LENGTH=82 /DNA_ID=CAMNT_0048056813 /DNA_START=718 /DNA_END=966 /DNA_ORIENTATION=-